MDTGTTPYGCRSAIPAVMWSTLRSRQVLKINVAHNFNEEDTFADVERGQCNKQGRMKEESNQLY